MIKQQPTVVCVRLHIKARVPDIYIGSSRIFDGQVAKAPWLMKSKISTEPSKYNIARVVGLDNIKARVPDIYISAQVGFLIARSLRPHG